MHIPDAVLTPPVWVPLAAVSAAAVGLASAKARQQLEDRKIPVAGVLGATLLTVLVGPWLAILVMSAVLVVQCFLFNDGGVTALGANIFNMAVIATVTTTLVLRFSLRVFGDRKGRLVAGALGGWLAVFLGAIACTLELVAAGRFPLWKSLLAMGGFHAVIGLAEGAITVAALSYILGVRPDVVHAFAPRR